MTHDTPIELNDELLGAFLDNELDAVIRLRIEQALANDAGARARLERLRFADASIRHAFELQATPQGDPVVAYIQSGKPLPALRSRATRRGTMLLGALAAGMGGVVVGYLFATQPSQPALQLSTTLTAVLEGVASGAAYSRSDESASVLLTFKAADGRYCRVFDWRTRKQQAEGLACRSDGAGSSEWEILAWDATTVTSNSAASGGEFHPAGASETIDGAMDKLGGAAPLDAAAERELIERKWKARQ